MSHVLPLNSDLVFENIGHLAPLRCLSISVISQGFVLHMLFMCAHLIIVSLKARNANKGGTPRQIEACSTKTGVQYFAANLL